MCLRRITLLSLLIAAIIVLGHLPGSSATIDLTVGLGQSRVIWETNPSPFAAVTNWLTAGWSLGFGATDFSMGISLLDFETLRLKEHPSLSFVFERRVLQRGPILFGGSVGLVWNPYSEWIGVAVGASASWSPLQLLNIYTEVHVEVAPESKWSSAGACIGVSAGFSFRFPLFE